MNLLVGASPSVTYDAGQVSGRILEARLPVTLRWALLFLFLVSLFSVLVSAAFQSRSAVGVLCAESAHVMGTGFVSCCLLCTAGRSSNSYILCNFDDNDLESPLAVFQVVFSE